MKYSRQLAAALACTLTLGLCAGQALADGTPAPGEVVAPPLLILPAPAPAPEQGENQPTAPAEPAPLPGLDAPSTRRSFIRRDSAPAEALGEDAPGTLSFENLEQRLRENNLNLLALDENLESIEAVDLEEMEEGLNMAIQMISRQQDQLEQLVEGTSAALQGLQSAMEGQNLGMDLTVFQPALIAYPQATIAALQTQIDTYQETLEQIEDGTIEAQYDSAKAQLTDAQHQIVMGGQTLYLTLLGLEQTHQGLQRNLDALDRTLAQLEVRYEMGQISALTLAETKAGRTSLLSGMETLSMNMTALRRQLEGMLDEEITGTIQLQPLTAVTGEQLAKLDYEKDLKAVKRYSNTLDSANQKWHDAEDAYRDLNKSSSAPDYEVEAARYTARAADLTRQATEQSLELSFAALYDKVADQQQVLAAARTSLAVKEDALSAARIKYEQGTISHHTLLSAQDARDEALDTADTAAIDLFTTYNNYCWAVEHGILN